MLPFICDAITPLLLIALLGLPWLYAGRLARSRFVILIAAQTAVGIATTYSLMAMDNLMHWWPRGGMDYSTHTAFALSLALPLLKHHHWAWAGLLLFYGVCMYQLQYHSWADMLTTALAWAVISLPFIYGLELYLIKGQGERKSAT